MGWSLEAWRAVVKDAPDAERLLGLHPNHGGTPQSFREIAGAAERAEKPKREKSPDGMNKTERRFAAGLEGMKERHEIRDFAFEPEKFRMADRTWYGVDFRVTLNSGQNVFVEVKVFKKDGSVLWTDDGAVKCKTVPEIHPYAFFLAAYSYSERGWEITRIPSRNYGWITVDLEWRI